MENSSPSATLQESPTPLRSPDGFTLGRTVVTAVALLFAALIGNIVPTVPWAFSHMYDPAALRHPPVNILIAAQVGMDAAAIICLLALLRWAAKTSFRELGFRVPPIKVLGIAVLGAAAMFLAVNGLGTLIDTTLKTHHQQVAVELFRGIRDPQIRVQFALFAVVLGPAAEELGFRIFLFNAFMRRSSFWIAALASSLLFGAAHLDVYAFFPLVLGGLILCAVYYRSGNAWAPIFTHGIFNLGSLVALYLAPQLTK